MRRALIYLNLYGCEAVRHKGKNSLKNIAFFACFCPYVHNFILTLKITYNIASYQHIQTNPEVLDDQKI